jgi:hypothetical protein
VPDLPDLPGPPEDAPGNTGDAADTGEPPVPGTDAPGTDAERRRRRAEFLRDLAEARELRARVQPRRAKAARLRHAQRMRTFRW